MSLRHLSISGIFHICDRPNFDQTPWTQFFEDLIFLSKFFGAKFCLTQKMFGPWISSSPSTSVGVAPNNHELDAFLDPVGHFEWWSQCCIVVGSRCPQRHYAGIYKVILIFKVILAIKLTFIFQVFFIFEVVFIFGVFL